MKRALMSVLLSLCVAPVFAGQWMAYTSDQFSALTKAGHTVIVDVHADWCPTCLRQQPALKQLVGQSPFQSYDVLVVNYDQQADVLKKFNVSQQSTLLVFKGDKEVGRATGITEPKAISALLDKGR